MEKPIHQGFAYSSTGSLRGRPYSGMTIYTDAEDITRYPWAERGRGIYPEVRFTNRILLKLLPLSGTGIMYINGFFWRRPVATKTEKTNNSYE